MKDWFLPVPMNRDIKWCKDIAYTNYIKVFLSYPDYYARLSELIGKTQKGDEIFICGWGSNFYINLDSKNTAITLLKEAYKREVSIRFLSSPTVDKAWADNEAAVKSIEDFNKNKSLPIAFIDNQLFPVLAKNFHQKAVFITVNKIPYLFIGGMDIVHNRDTWIDSQVELRDSAALLGRITLLERWNSVQNQFFKDKGITVPTIGNNYSSLYSVVKGKFKVQFIRTYSPTVVDGENIIRDYAPWGDCTYFELIKRAITNSNKSLYQEDQFFKTIPELQKNSHQPEERSFCSGGSINSLIYQKANRSDFYYLGIGMDFFTTHLLSKGFNKNRFNKPEANENWSPLIVKPIDPNDGGNPTKPFIHSKSWIFDDELVVIGSANYWELSYMNEIKSTTSEFGVAFTCESDVTGDVYGCSDLPYVHALRLRMMERIKNWGVKDENKTYFKKDAASNWPSEMIFFSGNNFIGNNNNSLYIPM